MGLLSEFETYLRTGRLPQQRLELKFNPWHNPEDGRFTFAGQGSYFGGSSQRNRGSGFRGRGGKFGGGGAGDSWSAASSSGADPRTASRAGSRKFPRQGRQARSTRKFDPRNPRNYSIHSVRRGETLTSIAATRRGLRVADLAWLNGISPDQPLNIERLQS